MHKCSLYSAIVFIEKLSFIYNTSLFGHGSRSVQENFSTSDNSAGLPGPANNVLPTYCSKSTQNVLEAAQIKRCFILANVLKVIIFEGIVFVCVCVCPLPHPAHPLVFNSSEFS